MTTSTEIFSAGENELGPVVGAPAPVRVLAGFGQMERGGTHGSPSLNRLLLGILAQNAPLNQYKTACPTFLSNIGRLRNLLGVAVTCHGPGGLPRRDQCGGCRVEVMAVHATPFRASLSKRT